MTKETAIKVLRHEKDSMRFDAVRNEALILAIEALKQLPKEKRTISNDSMYWVSSTVNEICSACGGRGSSAYKFCPHCGKKNAR